MAETVFAPALEGMKHVKSEQGDMLTKPFLEVCKQILPVIGTFTFHLDTYRCLFTHCCVSFPKYLHVFMLYPQCRIDMSLSGTILQKYGLILFTWPVAIGLLVLEILFTMRFDLKIAVNRFSFCN